jgi:hypothetical protein
MWYVIVEPSYHWWSPFIGGARGDDTMNTECKKISPPTSTDDSESNDEIMFCEDQLIDLMSEKKVRIYSM